MATALDLLMSAKEDVNLLSEESDICTIDAKTRVIFVPSTIVVGGVQSDKNAERIKFSCPKIVGDNLDLSKFSVRINFENVSSVDFNVSIKDQYICDDVAVDGENVTFSWLIGRNAARYMGTVRFIVCAVKTDSDSNISVEWNTTIAEVPVLEGIEIDQPQIGQEEKDVINQLLELTKNTSAEAVQNVNSAKEQAIKDIQSVSQPDTTLTIEGGLAEAKATGEAIGSLKEDLDDLEVVAELYGSMYVMAGYYANGKHNESSFILSKHYDVAGCDKINATITTDQNYDIYDFLDDSFNVISYKREIGSSKTIETSLNVPDNARYFAVNGRFVEKTVIKGTLQLKNEQKLHDIKPAVVLNGYWNVQRNAFEYSRGYHYSLFDVSLYKRGQIEADAFEFSKAVVLLDENKSLIRDLNSGRFYNGNGHYKISVDFEDVAYVGVSTESNKVPIVNVLAERIKKEQNLFEKSIVWFGTSIPAAGLYGLNNENTYPNRVGKILSANVLNESVGSSAITCKSPDRITESNPYGFTHDFEGCSRCLTNTIEEMNWIIEHYNDSSVFDYRTVSSLSESDKDFIRSCSYENKLLPYLTSIKCPDLFVFDHGHNDNTNDIKESYYSETVKINGTEENGWYSNGVYQESQHKESIKFDVSNYSQVLLSGTIGAWRDIYDLFDENEHNIGFEKVNVGVSVDYANKEIDVKGAKYLVVSNNNNLLSSVSLKGYKYDRNHNLYCYQGAMRFLLNFIFSFNPKQRVVMIGEYENERQPYIAKYQDKVADEWNFPIYRQWEEYGWSNNKIKTKWYWNNGVWTLGTKEQTITILNCWLADTVHPHSDSSGKTLQFMADHIASWMKDNIFLLN